MARTKSIIEEGVSAGRGVAALIIGDRKAPSYFDFSPRGLAGSFIALLVISGLNASMPKLLGATGPEASIFRSAVMIAILFVFQMGFSVIVLRQLKRLDGLVPYLVADNWATFFITIGAGLLALLGLSGDFALLGIAVLVIAVEINIARLIVTLSPLQIAMFLIAQLVGVSIALFVVGWIFPLTPAEVAALSQ